MQVKDVMKKSVAVCSPEDSVSSVLGKMKAHKIHQLPVVENGQVLGMITLEKIVKKDIDPASTKVSSIVLNCPSVLPEASLEEAAESILGSNLRAIPVIEGGLKGMVSEMDIIRNMKIGSLEREAKEAVVVEEKDNIGKVKKIMSYENLSRVPVVREGKCVGMVGTMELIKVLEAKQKIAARGGKSQERGSTEKISLDETSVSAVMRPASVLKAGSSAADILEKLMEDEEVLIQNGSLKIITPKDVLRTIHTPRKSAYVQITGLDDDDSELAEKMHKESEMVLKRIYRVSEVQPMKIMIERHAKGGKTKYSISVQLPTQLGTFVSTKSYGWNALAVAQHALKSIEREFFKKHGRMKAQGKRAAVRRKG